MNDELKMLLGVALAVMGAALVGTAIGVRAADRRYAHELEMQKLKNQTCEWCGNQRNYAE
tara:strand:+ start:213 stop:392 length:180 start_codon:yes stop_codon:yes gene_type:complete